VLMSETKNMGFPLTFGCILYDTGQIQQLYSCTFVLENSRDGLTRSAYPR
jgi:hypothetical protein